MKLVDHQICINAHFYLKNLHIDSTLKEIQRRQVKHHFKLYGSGTDTLLSLYNMFCLHLKIEQSVSNNSIVQHANVSNGGSTINHNIDSNGIIKNHVEYHHEHHDYHEQDLEVDSSENTIPSTKQSSSNLFLNEQANISLPLETEQYSNINIGTSSSANTSFENEDQSFQWDQKNIDLEICQQCINYLQTESIPKSIFSFGEHKGTQHYITRELKPTILQNSYKFDKFSHRFVHIHGSEEAVYCIEDPVLQVSYAQWTQNWKPLAFHTNDLQFESRPQSLLQNEESSMFWRGNIILIQGDISYKHSLMKDEMHYTKSINTDAYSHCEKKYYTNLIAKLKSLSVNLIIASGKVDKFFVELCINDKILVLDSISEHELRITARSFNIMPIYTLEDLLQQNSEKIQFTVNQLHICQSILASTVSLGKSIHTTRRINFKDVSPIYIILSRCEKQNLLEKSAQKDIDLQENTSKLENQATVFIVAPTQYQHDILEQRFETKFRLWSSIIKENKERLDQNQSKFKILPGHGYPWLVMLHDLEKLCARYQDVLGHPLLSHNDKTLTSRKIQIIEMFIQCFQGLLLEKMQRKGLSLEDSLRRLSDLCKLFEESNEEMIHEQAKRFEANFHIHETHNLTHEESMQLVLLPWYNTTNNGNALSETYMTSQSHNKIQEKEESSDPTMEALSDTSLVKKDTPNDATKRETSKFNSLFTPITSCQSFYSSSAIESILTRAYELFCIQAQSHHVILPERIHSAS